jgi:hypothetical protein
MEKIRKALFHLSNILTIAIQLLMDSTTKLINWSMKRRK